MIPAEARVRRLLAAALRIQDPEDPLGLEARRVLPGSTGLSPEGVALALEEHLETRPSDAEVRALCLAVEPAPRVHVVLSANVFVAAHRAIALALAGSADVRVRPSRREPEMTALIHRADPDLFHVVPALEAAPGDVVWAYGADETLEALRRELPEGVRLRAHGAGIGLVVLELGAAADLAGIALAVARDVVPFDQRGCASPRVVVVTGPAESASGLGRALAQALADAERAVPRGRVEPEELADAVRYRDTARFRGDELLEAGSGCVGVDLSDGKILVPPVGRNVHVVRTTDPLRTVEPLSGLVTSVGFFGNAALEAEIRAALVDARHSKLGCMQCPPFDGPVDRRGRARVH